jgi:hypothetical protein
MHHYARVCLVAVALLSASCADDDEDARLAGPSGLNTAALVVSATSTIVITQPVDNPFCPSVSPRNASVSLIAKATGSSAVFITGIRWCLPTRRGVRRHRSRFQ